MKIAVSAAGAEVSARAEERFGRCAYFVVFNENGELLEVIKNDGVEMPQGAGIKSAQMLIKVKTDQLEAETKIEFQDRIDGLDSELEQTGEKMNRIKESGGKAWNELKGGMNNAWEELSGAVNKASSKFKQ